MNIPQGISHVAGLLKNAEPEAYEKLLRLLDAYATELCVAVTECAPADILCLQGRAQQGRKLFQLFLDAKEPNKPTP